MASLLFNSHITPIQSTNREDLLFDHLLQVTSTVCDLLAGSVSTAQQPSRFARHAAHPHIARIQSQQGLWTTLSR